MIYKTCQLSPNVNIGGKCTLSNTKIGSYSYLGTNCKIHYTTIGKFCSIGSDVKIGLSNHPTETFVSTSPYFYLPDFNGNKSFVKKQYFDPIKPIDIGNDVWIGANVLINDGVNIGDGAIIAAGAVVTKDVKPYAIVGGVPAKEIKLRFTQEQREKLIALKWWDKELDWIVSNLEEFRDIESLLNKLIFK
jgi:acetyltransferase-like isoleucine patch superfamily enzyme